MITKIIILGAAGDGRVVADAVRQAQSCASPVELVGFLDDGRTTAVDDLPMLVGIRNWRPFDSSIGSLQLFIKSRRCAPAVNSQNRPGRLCAVDERMFRVVREKFETARLKLANLRVSGDGSI